MGYYIQNFEKIIPQVDTLPRPQNPMNTGNFTSKMQPIRNQRQWENYKQ